MRLELVPRCQRSQPADQFQLDSLPPALVRVMAVPRDIAIAVRISTEDIHDRPSDDEAEARPAVRSSSEVDTEDLEDLFDELGVEFLDDTGLGYQEEDEKRTPPPCCGWGIS